MPNLDELSISLKSAALGRQLWETLLTEPERQLLGGDLEACWEQLGTIGMWLRLRGGSRAGAIAILARQLDLVTEMGFRHLMRELGEPDVLPPDATPTWDRDRGELRLGATICRRIPSPKRGFRIAAILDAFQEEGWPTRIDDPLPGGPNPQRLREVVSNLNDGLTGVRFRTDGSGEAVVWEPV